jgi:phenylacetate-CoA ligase
MLNIADEMDRQGVEASKLALRVGIFGAEPWTESMRQELEARLDIDAVDIYGLSEVMGPGVAQECIETKDGPTIWEEHFYPEIIHPETGEVLPEGEFGELVFTSLTKEAMPIVRYRTRDLTRLLPGTARTMRRMQKITGRSDDMMIVRGVNVFPTQIEELILQRADLAPHYVCELGKDGPMDTLTVRVELKAEAHADASTAIGAQTALAHAIKSYIGVSAKVKVEPAGAIERSIGKAKRVIDNRPKGG